MKRFSVLAMASLLVSGFAAAAPVIHDVATVNGHPGYITAWETSGALDKVLLLVTGFDTDNDDHPVDDLYGDYQPLLNLIGPLGWDVIIFDYVDGSTYLEDNADNLARFIEYLNTQAVANYHLAIVGGSMGGIVARTMFVQENSAMGAETFVSVDSPHWGVTLSPWVEGLAELALDYPAAHQMHNGDPAYSAHYGWLRSVETNGTFLPNVIGPMATLAIALSNGESSWKLYWDDAIIHSKYHPVCSYVISNPFESDYMPYHSTMYLDNTSTSKSNHLGYTKYWYNSTATSYFDQKQANPKAVHGAPAYVVEQAVNFVLANGP
jgi:pimeloyl-ACP methyl ester carboxylesterase